MKGFFQMKNYELENEVSVSPSKTMETQTDMTYWSMSRRSYLDIDELTDGRFTKPENVTAKDYPSLYVDSTPSEQKRWDIVKALDDEETDTQALAFKKGDEIVISYRGSQEAQDWFGTDPDYLVVGGNMEPSKTRINSEILSDAQNSSRTLSMPNAKETPKDYEQYEQMDLKNPFDVAADFAEDVKADFPNAEVDTTGHSLGGALATYSGVMASYEGESFVRNTTTYAAPNVYGMLPEEVQEQADQGEFRDNTINYTDKSDSFGTLNDKYPQVGEQMYVDNQKFWLVNHRLTHFEHLFVTDGDIQLTPDTMRELADQSEDILTKINNAYSVIDEFEDEHDEKIKEIQNHFEDQIGSTYDKLEISDVKTIIDKFARTVSAGKPKFYKTVLEKELLSSLEKLQKESKDIKKNLKEMAEEFENKDEIVADWLKIQ